jgi:hypothetical protein
MTIFLPLCGEQGEGRVEAIVMYVMYAGHCTSSGHERKLLSKSQGKVKPAVIPYVNSFQPVLCELWLRCPVGPTGS